MSNFTLKLNPLSGVSRFTSKRREVDRHWAGCVGYHHRDWRHHAKGQRNKDKASAPTPTQINTSMTTKQAALDSVLAQSPIPPPESGGANAHSNWHCP